MATASGKIWDMYEELKNKFLFNSDFNSIYILLTLYDLEENISNICPKYYSTKNIKKRISHVLKDKKGSENIAHNISVLIHEDINRLELCFYLEGYKFGYFNSKIVNELEEKALEIYGLEDIYKNKHLFHFRHSDLRVKKIYKNLRRMVDNIEKTNQYFEKLIHTFSNKIIKKKLKKLDNYIHKQLIMDFDLHNYSIKEECCKLKEEEIHKIYSVIVNILVKNMKDIYKDAAWSAVNDKVLKRYM